MKCVENPRAVSHGAAQSAPPRRRTNPGKIARRAGTTILALLFCVVWFFPVYWMIITAVKPRDEIMTTTPEFWPVHLTIVLSIIVGRKPIMVFVLAIQMTSGGIIPQIIIYNQLGLLNKYSGLILAYIAMVLPFAIWNMRGVFLNIPKDIFESAAVEGANDWQILWKITFPLIGPFFTINLVLSMKNALGTFDQVVALTEGGPNSSTETVTYLIWKGGLTGGEYAYKTANAVLFFIVLAIIAFVQLRISRSQEQI